MLRSLSSNKQLTLWLFKVRIWREGHSVCSNKEIWYEDQKDWGGHVENITVLLMMTLLPWKLGCWMKHFGVFGNRSGEFPWFVSAFSACWGREFDLLMVNPWTGCYTSWSEHQYRLAAPTLILSDACQQLISISLWVEKYLTGNSLVLVTSGSGLLMTLTGKVIWLIFPPSAKHLVWVSNK